ncbi:MAG: peptidase S1, partial [Rhodococcus sp. (in: high G+C Gram-positive bacteria)]
MTDDRRDSEQHDSVPTQENSAQHNPTQQFPTQQGPSQDYRQPGQYGPPTYGQNPYTQGYGQQQPHATPTHHEAPQQAPAALRSRPGRATLAAGAIALVLVGGGIGGAVGVLAAGGTNGSGTATNSLNSTVTAAQPAANIPDGSIQAVADKVLPSVVQ